ncbi:MAG TPA: serine/threonine-protein kinase [Thermoanaerobaculia bacterium]|nr:serine/threonine-protein kinase [Thermoanaerobaculia bacterium]
MDKSDRWRRMRELFEELVDLSPQHRRSALDEVGAGDPELARQVESLLSWSPGAASALDGAVADALASAAAGTEDGGMDELAPGARLGPYALEREIGRGGMGVVFLATRADRAYRAAVAVKVLRASFTGDGLQARFRTERQILADLDHPNVARLLDGGATPSGRPFLVMEHVEGRPITEFCDRGRLDTEARLELFLEVCDAVRFAHRNLVVHRDLKPANILVTAEGRPKLLDFGIAKLLEPDRSEHTLAATEAGTRLMTPGYASPEQILGEPVTTAADVYSLGVLLYELLAGRLPWEPEETLPAAVRRVLADASPRPPSTAVTRAAEPATTAPTAEQIAAARRAHPRLLQRRLRGDLDDIVLMALRREPERRYASVDHLAEDVRRHLAGQPVSARPSTAGYRARKFVGRHREAVAIAAVLAALLVSLVGFYTQRLRNERIEAQREAAKARRVSEFVVDLFEVSDPSRSRGETITARELLDQGQQRLRGLDAEPAVQAAMMDTIGNVYRTLALYDEAEPLLEGALEQRRRLAAGAPSPDVAESLQSLGRLRAAQGDAVAAEELQRRGLETWRALRADGSAELARSADDLGAALFDRGDYAAAERAHREALSIWRERGTPSSEERAHSLDRLAAALHEQGRYDEAERSYRDALAIRLEIHGEGSLEVSNSYSNLGNLLRYVDRPEESEAAHRRALGIRLQVLGPAHPDLTTSLNSLAVLLASQERLEEALPLFRQALDIRVRTLGPDHPRVGVPLTGLADATRRLGRLEEAEALYRRSLDLHRASLPSGHPFIAHPLVGLGTTRAARGDHDEAARLYREALEIRRSALEDSHWEIPYTEGLLGRELVELGEVEEGLALLKSSRARLTELLGAENSRTIAAGERLAAALAAAGRAPEHVVSAEEESG